MLDTSEGYISISFSSEEMEPQCAAIVFDCMPIQSAIKRTRQCSLAFYQPTNGRAVEKGIYMCCLCLGMKFKPAASLSRA